jgi:mono/diheme cytochrome c family protein
MTARTYLTRAVGLAGLLLAAGGCQGEVGAAAAPPFPVPDAGQVVDGMTLLPTGPEIFAAACAPCHGALGQGTALAYELQHPVRPFSEWVVRHGRPGTGFATPMAAYSTALFSDQQLGQIWDYLAAFPQPTTGKDLYLDYCGNCHGADARGGSVDKEIVRRSIGDVTDKVRGGAGGTGYGVRGKYMPAWTAAQLSDAELALIVQYLAGL